MIEYTKYIDIRLSDLTVKQMMEAIIKVVEDHPEQEIFWDGDLQAIVGKERVLHD